MPNNCPAQILCSVRSQSNNILPWKSWARWEEQTVALIGWPWHKNRPGRHLANQNSCQYEVYIGTKQTTPDFWLTATGQITQAYRILYKVAKIDWCLEHFHYILIHTQVLTCTSIWWNSQLFKSRIKEISVKYDKMTDS